MESTIEKLIELCAGIENRLAGTTLEEVFGAGSGIMDFIVSDVQQIGDTASMLQNEKKGGVLADAVPYLQSISKVLQCADAGIAFTFCKYDMQGFVKTCTLLLETDGW